MPKVVKALQSVTSLPLQLDSSNVQALENGLRVYNGKPIVNSTNGEQEKLDAILPLCKKYGAAIVGLAIDERGILPAAEDRVAIARRITEAALAVGIPREDIYIDCLTLTASAQQKDVLATVQALEACKKELGVRTILGVSNISFGLSEHHLPHHGHVRRAGPCHHEPLQRGDDGGGVCLQRADQPRSAEHQVH